MTTLTPAILSTETANSGANSRSSCKARVIQNILVAIDFSECSKAALNQATFLAEAFGATLTLVHVVEPYIYPEDLSAGFTIEELDARWIEKQKEKMEALRRTIKEGIPESVVVTMGTVWNRIVGMAKTWNADLIVIGTHGSTLKHALIGSTAERVVRHAACPVLVVPFPPKAASVSQQSVGGRFTKPAYYQAT
jgi:universal stress protein A